MEKSEVLFEVHPQLISIPESDQIFTIFVKNIGNRVCHYEIFVPNWNHFKILGDRTFSLAPGITKNVKIKHLSSTMCRNKEQYLEVIDIFGNRKSIDLFCELEEVQQSKKIELAEQIVLDNLIVKEERTIQIPIKNISNENFKVKIVKGSQYQNQHELQLKIHEEKFIFLKKSAKVLKLTIKMLQEVATTIAICLQMIEEESKKKQSYFLKIKCNSLFNSQYLTDKDNNKIDSLKHSFLNGTSNTGSFFLVNNYHESRSFKINQNIELQNYQTYTEGLSELFVEIDQKEGVIKPKSRIKINYEIFTTMTQNDKSFVLRYSQLSEKDETYSYKLKNSKFFKKFIKSQFKVIFGTDNLVLFEMKNTIVNPAIRVRRIPEQKADMYELFNDTEFEIPFKMQNNTLFSHKFEQNYLSPGVNTFQIIWKQNEGQFGSSSKENLLKIKKCSVKMEIPQNQITLFEHTNQSRPKTALFRESRSVMDKETLRQKISARAPSKRGDFGIKQFKDITSKDYMQKESKYIKHELLAKDQFHHLQVNYNEKGYVLTNSHPTKNIMINVLEKGFLLLQNYHSYMIPYEKKWLKLEHNGKILEIKPKDIDDSQMYKIKNKELLFCFSISQKSFEVVKEIQIVNKSNEVIRMHCLSVDDQFFHSLEKNHKIVIPPKQTAVYKVSFEPEAEKSNKAGKVTRQMEFLVNDVKEVITCEGDFLPATVVSDTKSLVFENCPYSFDETSRTFKLSNKGISKVNYRIKTSSAVRVSPQSGVISEKSRQDITIAFRPSELEKQYFEQIAIEFKGSHIMHIPLKVTTLEPKIYCKQTTIDFHEGYIKQNIFSTITIVNENPYPCTINLRLSGTDINTDRQVVIDQGSSKDVELKLYIKDVGQRKVKLPHNFIELKGYGAIRGPKQYRFFGKETVLQIFPDNPFKNIQCSHHQEKNSFKLKNISDKMIPVELVLQPQTKQSSIILSCEPNTVNIFPGKQKQLSIYSIRTNEEENLKDTQYFEYTMNIFINKRQKYQTFNFKVAMLPPVLNIEPKQIFFPLACVGTWSKSNFTITNLGYKEVFVSVKKPTNIAFELNCELEKNINCLTKLTNAINVNLLYKSKKPISFSTILEIENNFGQKYEVKINGTTSKSPLLKCDQTIGSSSSVKSFSSKNLKSVALFSMKSLSNQDSSNEDHESFKFFSKWIEGIFPESLRNNESYNIWLTKSRNLLKFLDYIGAGVPATSLDLDESIQSILEELKKNGYPIYSIRLSSLLKEDIQEWSNFLWFVLSKNIVNQDCLKWVNKSCGINLETYENAFNHQRKILIDLFSKFFESIFKSKITDFQRLLDIFEPSFPILSNIENKRQFILVLNLLFKKFSKYQVQNIALTSFNYNVNVPYSKGGSQCCILSNQSFSSEISGNYHEDRYLPDKKMLSFSYLGEPEVNLRFKEDTSFAVWNNHFSDPIKIFNVSFKKKTPIVHNITVECEDQCTQEWNLDFVCSMESQYIYQFYGGIGGEFKCRAPELGIIKAGSIMKFTIAYSPTNLKEHEGVLKISNKFEDHVYNLKGKPLITRKIQMERIINVVQGTKYQETFGIPQDSGYLESESYKIKQIDQKTEELKSCSVKSNGKQVIVSATLEYSKVIQNQKIFLQVTNKNSTFCKNIAFIVNVIPRPKIIKGQLKGVIEKTTTQKIPITNLLNEKQNCWIKIYKIDQQTYENFTYEHIEKDEEIQTKRDEWQFNLSHIDKIILKPKETQKIFLSYLPTSFNEAYCQVRIRIGQTKQLLVYNYRGIPELPSTTNKLIEINTRAETQTVRTIKIPNKIKQNITFQVETNFNFIAGPEQIVVPPRETYSYNFKVVPLHEGSYEGQIVFKNQKFCLIYPLLIKVSTNKKLQIIQVKSQIRVSNTISIQLANKTQKNIEYKVLSEKDYLQFPDKFMIPAESEKPLVLKYTPLFIGTRTVELKLFNELANEIIYLLEMTSEPTRQQCNIDVQIGQAKKFKLFLNNPTAFPSQLEAPVLPPYLKAIHSLHAFPLTIPPKSNIPFELVFNQKILEEKKSVSIQLKTDTIGTFIYDLTFQIIKQKILPKTIVQYEVKNVDEIMKKDISLELFNPFQENLSMLIKNRDIKYNENIKFNVDSKEEFSIKPFEKKILKVKAQIKPQKGDRSTNRTHEDKIVTKHKEFTWVFPITFIELKVIPLPIQIVGPSHQLIRSRVTLKNMKNVKKWEVDDLPQYDKIVKTIYLSSNDFYIEAIINKNFQYQGFITFFEEDVTSAEQYPLNIRIGGKKVQFVSIQANVGQTGTVKIKAVNGGGKFNVQFKNNKKKQFNVYPLSGVFNENDENQITFEYTPIQYNGIKKAEARIISEGGNFDFYITGKFPKRKPS